VLAGTPRSVRTVVQDGPTINFHRPSVDLFFQTVARVCGPAAVGVVMTGMGEDGARGMLAMRQAGASTLGQDEASSIVYGMPKAAFEIGAVARQVGLANLPAAIVDAVRARIRPPVGTPR
jgi:two-component system chemotaxis response regulator CheB